METDFIINRKIKACLAHDLIPILCIGETEQERGEGATFKVIETQLTQGLDGVTKEQAISVVIAYEPVWAIGTGETATPEQAQEVHAYIRKLLTDTYGEETASKMRILYGGSVNPENIQKLISQQDVNGALVGGASLDPESFAAIVRFSRL